MARDLRVVDVTALKESDAWPAEPQDAYGFEKLQTEVLCKNYQKVRRVASRSCSVITPCCAAVQCPSFYLLLGALGLLCAGLD